MKDNAPLVLVGYLITLVALVAVVPLLVSACTSDKEMAEKVTILYKHDAQHGVSCWWSYQGLSCLPDSQVRLP